LLSSTTRTSIGRSRHTPSPNRVSERPPFCYWLEPRRKPSCVQRAEFASTVRGSAASFCEIVKQVVSFTSAITLRCVPEQFPSCRTATLSRPAMRVDLRVYGDVVRELQRVEHARLAFEAASQALQSQIASHSCG